VAGTHTGGIRSEQPGYYTDYDAFRRTSLENRRQVLILGAASHPYHGVCRRGFRLRDQHRGPDAQQTRRSGGPFARPASDARINLPGTLRRLRQAAGSQERRVVLNGTPVGLWPHVVRAARNPMTWPGAVCL
jgi:hypothetical protein